MAWRVPAPDSTLTKCLQLADMIGVMCDKFGKGHWTYNAHMEPILSVVCDTCRSVTWIGFLAEEWDKFVRPLVSPG